MGTAVQVAMDLGLHRSDANIPYPTGEEWKRDMRRRTWWMVFSDLMQASVISGTVRFSFDCHLIFLRQTD